MVATAPKSHFALVAFEPIIYLDTFFPGTSVNPGLSKGFMFLKLLG